MITVLTKNYDIDDLEFLSRVIRKGVKSTTGCDVRKSTRSFCNDCSMKVVCDDLARVVRFCEKNIERELDTETTIIATTENIEPITITNEQAIIKIKRGE